jgi:hypothetical protein
MRNYPLVFKCYIAREIFSPHKFKYFDWHMVKNVLDKTTLDTTASGTTVLDKTALE